MDDHRLKGKQRVSCAGLCRVRDESGEYLLGLNISRLERGRRHYTPLGGGLQVEDEALLERFDALPEEPGSRDLRLYLDPAQLDAFREWFHDRTQRELSVFRELKEELVEEFCILPTLSADDVDIRYAHTFEGRRASQRPRASNADTLYFHDIYDVEFSRDIHAVLRRAPLDTGLRWFPEEELRDSTTPDGASVDGSALLR